MGSLELLFRPADGVGRTGRVRLCWFRCGLWRRTWPGTTEFRQLPCHRKQSGNPGPVLHFVLTGMGFVVRVETHRHRKSPGGRNNGSGPHNSRPGPFGPHRPGRSARPAGTLEGTDLDDHRVGRTRRRDRRHGCRRRRLPRKARPPHMLGARLVHPGARPDLRRRPGDCAPDVPRPTGRFHRPAGQRRQRQTPDSCCPGVGGRRRMSPARPTGPSRRRLSAPVGGCVPWKSEALRVRSRVDPAWVAAPRTDRGMHYRVRRTDLLEGTVRSEGRDPRAAMFDISVRQALQPRVRRKIVSYRIQGHRFGNESGPWSPAFYGSLF